MEIKTLQGNGCLAMLKRPKQAAAIAIVKKRYWSEE
jgi:hypothetical protein